MVERILSKTQKRIFVALAQQRAELQDAFQEVAEAERDQIEMLRERYGMPEGTYQLRQENDGRVVLYRQAEPERDDGDNTPR